MDVQPDIEAMRNDFYSASVNNEDHYIAMKEVYDRFGVILEPHGAVGWRALDTYLGGNHNCLSVFYETADPGKFPDDVKQAIDMVPPVPPRFSAQASCVERVYSIDNPPFSKPDGSLTLSEEQYQQAKEILKGIFT